MFLSDDLPYLIQLAWLAVTGVVYITCIWFYCKRIQTFLMGIFLIWSLIFIVPFIFGLSTGAHGYVGRVITDPKLDPLLLSLYLWQVVAPLVFVPLGFQGGSYFIKKNLHSYCPSSCPRSISLSISFIGFFYLLIVFFSASPLYDALTGNFIEAMSGRKNFRAGDLSDYGVVKYYRFILSIAACFFLFEMIYNRGFVRFFWGFAFLLSSFVDFSKGGLALNVFLAFIFYLCLRQVSLEQKATSYKNWGGLLFAIMKALALSGLILVVYMQLVTGDSFGQSVDKLLLRIYQDSAIVYVQFREFANMAPLGLSVDRFGLIADLFGVESFIPRREAHSIIFGGAPGYSGSVMMSELYFFSGVLCFPLSIICFIVIGVIMGLVNTIVCRKGQRILLSPIGPLLIYIGTIFPFYTVAQPFKVFSPFSLFRIEVWVVFFISIAYLLVFSKSKNMLK
jgi:hypothetical protein